MKRHVGISALLAVLALGCTLEPEGRFDPGFGAVSSAGTMGTAGSTSAQEPAPQNGTSGGAASDETGAQQTSSGSDGLTTAPGSEGTDAGADTGGESESSGTDDPTGGPISGCPADTLDETTSGSTLGHSNAMSGSCGGDEAPERTFEFTAPLDGLYTFDTNTSDFDTVLYLLEGDCTGVELACDDDGGSATQSRLVTPLSAGQTVVVVVDGYGTHSSGAFVLNAAVQSATGCDASELSGPLPLTHTASTAGSSANAGSCGGGDAPEVALSWTAPQAGNYVIDTLGSSYDTVVYVRDGSCIGEELGCDDDGGPNTQSSLSVALQAGQDIVIFADGYSDDAGAVTLTISAG